VTRTDPTQIVDLIARDPTPTLPWWPRPKPWTQVLAFWIKTKAMYAVSYHFDYGILDGRVGLYHTHTYTHMQTETNSGTKAGVTTFRVKRCNSRGEH